MMGKHSPHHLYLLEFTWDQCVLKLMPFKIGSSLHLCQLWEVVELAKHDLCGHERVLHGLLDLIKGFGITLVTCGVKIIGINK